MVTNNNHTHMTSGGKAPVGADGKTISDMAREIMGAADPGLKAHETTEYLIASTTDFVKANSRLSHLRRALRDLKAPEAVVGRTQRREVSKAANEWKDMGFAAPGGLMHNGPVQHPHYQREAVLGRIAKMDTKRAPTKQDVINIMVALCMRPAEVKSLQITEKGVTGFAKGAISGDFRPRPFASILERERATELLGWVQRAISSHKLPDPGTPGSKPYRTLLAPYNLKPKDLRAIGANIYSESAQCDAERLYQRRLALRHLNLGPSAAERYSNVRQPEQVPDPEKTKAAEPKYMRWRCLECNTDHKTLVDLTGPGPWCPCLSEKAPEIAPEPVDPDLELMNQLLAELGL